MTEPFVVSVLDQKRGPVSGSHRHLRGHRRRGTLSATTATTDANGRATTTLTLGSQPGRNTVTARVARLNPVSFVAAGQAIPQSLTKLSGDGQQGAPGASLAQPFVVSVLDQNAAAFPGATVTFAVTGGGGSLSTTTATTDANGRAASTLTLGSQPGANTVTVSVAGLDPVTFTATAKATPDFDGDGEIGFSDFFLLADAFGGSDPRFDLDGSGSVDFGDFFLFADHFGQPARSKLLALAREMIGLPDGPQLQQNAPNPFNSETAISWFLLRPGPARVEVFALTGQRVSVNSLPYPSMGSRCPKARKQPQHVARLLEITGTPSSASSRASTSMVRRLVQLMNIPSASSCQTRRANSYVSCGVTIPMLNASTMPIPATVRT